MSNPLVTVNFAADTKALVDGVKDVGKATDGAASSAKKFSWKNLAQSAGVAAGVAAVTKACKDSVQTTAQLSKETLALQRVTKMETETASEWVAVMHTRGIETQLFNRSMVILSKNMYQATNGSAQATSAFEQLGVSMDDVKAGDTNAVLMQLVDGLSNMENASTRAALTQQLFGRASAKLTPVLYGGTDALQAQLDAAKKYGATVGTETIGSVKKMAIAQRDMELAMTGLKNTLGQALLPLFATLATVLASVVKYLQPLLRHTKALTVLFVGLTVAIIAYKVITIAATVAQMGLNMAMLISLGYFALAIAAVVALIAIGVLLVKHWDAIAAFFKKCWKGIKDGAEWCLNWIKANWPKLLVILTGPFGLAVVAIKNHWSGLVAWFGALVDKFAAVARRIADAIRKPINAVIGAWNSLSFTVPSVTIPGWDAKKVKGKTVLPGWGGTKLGGKRFDFPDIPKLATGGVFDVPTLALVGEGQGREVVAPESLLRQIMAANTPRVNVYIGDTELRDMVRVEVVSEDNRTAARLLGGLAY